MVKMTGQYQGQKHCEVLHGPSNSKLETDAPRDNNGKGERFSPTDLIGVALGTCVLTTMAIFAEKEGLNLEGSTFEVIKEMVANPRRIGTLTLQVNLPSALAEEKRAWLEDIGRNCPVNKSLHPDLKIPMSFHYASEG